LVVVIVFAIFLLLEQMQIRRTLVGWIRGSAQWVDDLLESALGAVEGLATSMTLSDLLGLLLLAGAAIFVVWRLRWRLTTMPRFIDRKCSRCGSDLHRVHRRRFDRVLNVFVPVRRYRCKNRACRWQGLRVSPPRHT
jgi:hypothetical protein